jgi:hypothetical protein
MFCRSFEHLITVRVNECVHFGAFRYGHGDYHPYETFVARVHRREPIEEIRKEFETFLRHYRPRNFGEALGLKLEREYPLWLFPWSRLWRFLRAYPVGAWRQDPKDVPDIITHFSLQGIPRNMIEMEQHWLLQAYESISNLGYKPQQFGYPRGRLLVAEDGSHACILLDGNHRVSALSVLGASSVDVRCWSWDIVRQSSLNSWPGVRNGFFSRSDADLIFRAYFRGNRALPCGDHIGAIVG